jgi:hypothetical protein
MAKLFLLTCLHQTVPAKQEISENPAFSAFAVREVLGSTVNESLKDLAR